MLPALCACDFYPLELLDQSLRVVAEHLRSLPIGLGLKMDERIFYAGAHRFGCVGLGLGNIIVT